MSLNIQIGRKLDIGYQVALIPSLTNYTSTSGGVRVTAYVQKREGNRSYTGQRMNVLSKPFTTEAGTARRARYNNS